MLMHIINDSPRVDFKINKGILKQPDRNHFRRRARSAFCQGIAGFGILERPVGDHQHHDKQVVLYQRQRNVKKLLYFRRSIDDGRLINILGDHRQAGC